MPFILGAHPQVTFYAGLFVGLWTFGVALEQAGYLRPQGSRSWRRTGAALGWWLGLGALDGADGRGPGRHPIVAHPGGHAVHRPAVVGIPGQTANETVRSLLGLVGPAPGYPFWEYRSGLTVLWIAAAAMAPVLGRGRVALRQVCACCWPSTPWEEPPLCRNCPHSVCSGCPCAVSGPGAARGAVGGKDDAGPLQRAHRADRAPLLPHPASSPAGHFPDRGQ